MKVSSILCVFALSSSAQAISSSELFAAAKSGRIDLLDGITAQDIDVRDEDGASALIIASAKGHADFVDFLLSKGADKKMLSRGGWSALLKASAAGHLPVVATLLNKCFKGLNKGQLDEETKNPNNGMTVLHGAAMNGHIAIAELLIQAGSELNAKNKDGATALMMAALRGHTAMVEILVKAGASKDSKGKDGWTALMSACSAGHEATAKALITLGANPRINNGGKATALDMGVCKGVEFWNWMPIGPTGQKTSKEL